MAPHFEVKTGRYVEMFGTVRPEGQLKYIAISGAGGHRPGLWTLYVVETPAGDRKLILHKDNETYLSFFPDLVTRCMFTLDTEWSKYCKLPDYVKHQIEIVVSKAHRLEA